MDAPWALFGIGCGVLGGVGWVVGFALAGLGWWVLVPVVALVGMVGQFGVWPSGSSCTPGI